MAMIIANGMFLRRRLQFELICVGHTCASDMPTPLCAQEGSTVLINAAENGHADCVRLLLESGADMEAKNNVRAAVAFNLFFV